MTQKRFAGQRWENVETIGNFNVLSQIIALHLWEYRNLEGLVGDASKLTKLS